MTVPLVQTVQPRKLIGGWRVTLYGFNLDLVLGVRLGSLDLITPLVQTARELVFAVPGEATAGTYALSLEGGYGELAFRGITVVELAGLDASLPASATVEDYTRQLFELLPKGPAWTRRIGTNMWKLFSACAEEFSRVHALALHLLAEVTPSQTSDALDEWETELGLPEKCVTTRASDDVSRRKEIFRKSNSLGGCSAAYFESLASLLGFTVRIEEYYSAAGPFKAGFSKAGDALTQGAWLFAWKVIVKIPASNVSVFTAGNGRAGDPLRWWGLEELECFLDTIKPSHTLVVYSYVYGEDFFQVGNDGTNMAGNDGTYMAGRI